MQQSTTISGEKTVTETHGWKDTYGVKVTMSGSVGIPLISDFKVSVEGSASWEQNGSTSTTRKFAWSQPVIVPAKSKVVATVAVTETTLSVPYTLSGSFVYGSGARVSGVVGGTFSGVNSHDLQVTLDPVQPRRHARRSSRAAAAGLAAAGRLNGRPRDERLELAVGGTAREVLHATVRGGDQPLRAGVREGAADAAGDRLGRLDVIRREVDDAEDDRLARQAFEDVEIEPGLRRLDAHLIALGRGELGQERVAGRAVRG